MGGAVVGDLALDRPDPEAPDWRLLRFVEQTLRECAAVVSYVADAEDRHGFTKSATHYRRLAAQAADALPVLRRLSAGSDALPITSLDEVRIGVERLALAVETLTRRAGRDDR